MSVTISRKYWIGWPIAIALLALAMWLIPSTPVSVDIEVSPLAIVSCVILVFAILWQRFHRFELALLSFMPLVISWALMQWGVSLHSIHSPVVDVVLAVFVFGQGGAQSYILTSAMVGNYATGHNVSSDYVSNVTLTVFMILSSVAVFLLADDPALSTLARLSAVAMFVVILLTLCLIPPLFRWLTRRCDGRVRLVPHTLKRFSYSLFAITFFVLSMFLFMLPFTWIYFHTGRNTEERRLRYHKILQRLSRFIIYRVPGVKYRVDNAVGEDFERPAVVVCNHQSHLDLMCLLMLTPRLVFLTNDWVWRNPLYGMVIHRAEFYPVSNGIENHVDQLRDLYNRGYSIAVFPEGTRSPDGRIGRFHKGAFYLARELGCEVLPIYLHGASDVLPKDDFMLRQGQIHMEVGRRVAVNDELLPFTKAFRAQYLEHYAELKKRLETKEYFVPLVRHQYYYKGRHVEYRSRRALAGRAPSVQGETELLAALTHPEEQFTATFDTEKNYQVATHLALQPSNLKFELKR